MPRTIPFTKGAIDRLNPADRRYFAYDKRAPGLCIAVHPSGAKSFYLYRRVGRNPERIRLGGYPAMTPEQARRQAGKLNGLIAAGVNPNEARRGRKDEPTIGDLWTAFERHAEAHRRPKTVKDYRLLYDARIRPWASRKLSSIDRTDVARLHARIGEKAPYAANRTLALLSAMFNRSHLVGWRGENPCRGVERFRERSRDRYLTADELPRFMQALQADESPAARDFFLVALFTGARRSNVAAMLWTDIDLKAGTWTIPAERAKAGETMTVYLPDVVLDVLRRRRAEQGRSAEWVFPADSSAGHLVDPMPWWRRICRRAGLADGEGKPTIRIHDLRRTLGSWQAAHGASLTVIGKSLGHRNHATATVYSRIDLNPVRASVDAAVNAMLQAATTGDDEDIAGKVG